MKTLFTFFLSMWMGQAVHAQVNSCGTQTPPYPVELPTTASPNKVQSVAIPLQIHIIRTSSGNTNVSYNNIQDQITLTNQQFAGSNLSFVECGPVNNIYDSDLYTFSYNSDNSDLLQHMVPNVVNVFYANTVIASNGNTVGGFAFFPWWTIPPASEHYVMVNANSHNDESTLAHELGHFFGLLHTHETAYGLELVDQSNCLSTGDELCDTPADPGLGGCTNSSCQYQGGSFGCPNTDPQGWTYNPATNNIMSYAYRTQASSCGTQFTNDQKNRMNILYPLRNYLQCNSSSGTGDTPCDPLTVSTDCNNPTPGDIAGASQSGIPIPTCTNFTSTQAQDRWYEFTATNDTALLTLNCLPGLDGVLALYSGSCSSPNFIDCVDSAGGSGQSELLIQYNLTVGQTYLVRVYEYNSLGTGTAFNLCIAFPASNSSNGADAAIDRLEVNGNAPVYVGDPVDLEAYITNVGTADLTSDIEIKYYINGSYVDDDLINGNDIPMAPGATNFQRESNYTFSSAGSYQYCVEITPHPDETNLSNNSNCITVPVLDPQYQINVSASPTNGGQVSGAGSFPAGTPHTVSASPNSGWSFDHWSENASQVSTSASYPFTVNADRSLVAHFSQSPNTYTINLFSNPSNGGSTSGSGTYNFNDIAPLVATPFSGWDFEHWEEGGFILDTNASFSLSVTANRTISAVFSQVSSTCMVTASANPSNGGTVLGGGNYLCGLSANLVAIPNTGWQFFNWVEVSSNPIIISTVASFPYPVNSNAVLAANFVPSVGVEEEQESLNSLYLYPNPSPGLVSMGSTQEPLNNLEVKVYDVSGRLVFEQSHIHISKTQHFELDLSQKSPGLYIVRAWEGNSIFTQKLTLR